MSISSKWLNKQFSFSDNGLLMKLINVKLLSVPGTIHTIYFALTFIVSQLLWLPVGSSIIFLLVLIERVINSFGVNIIPSADSPQITKVLFPVIFGVILITLESTISLFFVKKLDVLRNEKLSGSIIKLIVVVTTTASYLFFIYLIQDWWFLN